MILTEPTLALWPPEAEDAAVLFALRLDPEVTRRRSHSIATAARRRAGSPVSLGDLLEGLALERLVGQDRLQTDIFGLELFEALDVVGCYSAALVAPPVIRDLISGTSKCLATSADALALVEQPIGLAQLADDLLWGVPASLHAEFLARHHR